MKEQVISFETAKLAKEKGFKYVSTLCCKRYIDTGEIFDELSIPLRSWTKQPEEFQAPTQSLLQKWLRDVHSIDVSVISFGEIELYEENLPLNKTYSCRVDNWNVRWSVHDGTGLVMPEHYHFDDKYYEKALENGLQKALNLIK